MHVTGLHIDLDQLGNEATPMATLESSFFSFLFASPAKVDMPNLVTYPHQRPIFEWYVV